MDIFLTTIYSDFLKICASPSLKLLLISELGLSEKIGKYDTFHYFFATLSL